MFWCCVYAAEQLGSAAVHGRSLTDWWSPFMLLYGTSIHLWYLPFAFVVTSAAILAAKRKRLRDTAALRALVIVGLCTTLPAASAVLNYFDGPAPLTQWVFAGPSVVLGLGLGIGLRTEGASRYRWMGMLTLALLVACIVCVHWGLTDLPEPYLAGGLACVAATLVRGNTGRATAYVSGLTYGVYLVHPLVRTMCIRVGVLPERNAMAAVVIVMLSFTFVAVLRASPLRRFV
jgi:hypothetical protein